MTYCTEIDALELFFAGPRNWAVCYGELGIDEDLFSHHCSTNKELNSIDIANWANTNQITCYRILYVTYFLSKVPFIHYMMFKTEEDMMLYQLRFG